MKIQTSDLSISLHSAGLRITPQRLAICEFLAGSDKHPTAQQIFDELKPRFPSLSLATVYNTLEMLVNQGCINSLGNAGDAQMHYDAHTEPHVNVACVSCHEITDFPSACVEELEKELAEHSGYNLLGSRVLYYGICAACQRRQQ